MTTNFQKVSHLNNCFGNKPVTFKDDKWAIAVKQLGLIQEELIELIDGVEAQNIKEVRDAISDVLVTTYGLAHRLGINADADMEAVQQSNLSKLCKTEEELQATMAYYFEEIGIEVYSGGKLPEAFVKSSKDQEGKDGKFYPAHKFLKNTNWYEPVLV